MCEWQPQTHMAARPIVVHSFLLSLNNIPINRPKSIGTSQANLTLEHLGWGIWGERGDRR